MPDDQHNSSRLSGGILGVIALALAGSGAGVVGYYALGDNDAELATPAAKPVVDIEADNSVEISDTITLPEAEGDDDPAFEAGDGPDRMPAEIDIEIDDTQSPEPETPSVPPPRPAGRIFEEGAFVVRFNDNPEIKRCLDLYRKDKAASRAEFAEWASKHPDMDGLTLHRVNYSGEAILRYTGAEDANPVSNAKAIQARLNELPFVRYADPDFTAFPGKGE